jgi:polysaccharide deacetylase family protein (PEP-CTERM system associated)
MSGTGNLNALSVDVEEHFQVEAFADRISPAMWSAFPSRVVQNTQRVLDLLASSGRKATFFILGYVAERSPDLVRCIVEAGHEVACHGYWHKRVNTMTPEQFRDDIRRSKAAVESAAGVKVTGYRAPTFSLTRESLWALEILAEEGFHYDSSVFPVRHDFYGVPDAPRVVYRWQCNEGRELYEIPPLTLRFLGFNLAAGGGGYLRILPMWFTRWAMRQAQRERRPAVIYFHPWELDPTQPRLPGSWKSRFRHYRNLEKMEARLRTLMQDRTFVTMRQLLDQQKGSQSMPTFRPAEIGGGGRF